MLELQILKNLLVIINYFIAVTNNWLVNNAGAVDTEQFIGVTIGCSDQFLNIGAN